MKLVFGNQKCVARIGLKTVKMAGAAQNVMQNISDSNVRANPFCAVKLAVTKLNKVNRLVGLQKIHHFHKTTSFLIYLQKA
jgi:hypothetical protein